MSQEIFFKNPNPEWLQMSSYLFHLFIFQGESGQCGKPGIKGDKVRNKFLKY